MSMHTLKAGTTLYHGTGDPDFDETDDAFVGPAWLSDSIEVARRFSTRNTYVDEARPRVLEFVLEQDVEVHLIQSRSDAVDLSEEHGISFDGVEEMRDSVNDSGIPGWIIPNNYPEGADVMLNDTGVLRLVQTHPVEQPTASLGFRP